MEAPLPRLVTYQRGIGGIVHEDSEEMVAEQDWCRVS